MAKVVFKVFIKIKAAGEGVEKQTEPPLYHKPRCTKSKSSNICNVIYFRSRESRWGEQETKEKVK